MLFLLNMLEARCERKHPRRREMQHFLMHPCRRPGNASSQLSANFLPTKTKALGLKNGKSLPFQSEKTQRQFMQSLLWSLLWRIQWWWIREELLCFYTLSPSKQLKQHFPHEESLLSFHPLQSAGAHRFKQMRLRKNKLTEGLTPDS